MTPEQQPRERKQGVSFGTRTTIKSLLVVVGVALLLLFVIRLLLL